MLPLFMLLLMVLSELKHIMVHLEFRSLWSTHSPFLGPPWWKWDRPRRVPASPYQVKAW